MSVLLYDPVDKKHVLLLMKGMWADKRWSVNMHVCDNPCCGCFNITFKCTPEDADIGNPAPLSFVLDTEQHCIYHDNKHKSNTTGVEFANAVIKELSAEDWDYLQQFLLGLKQNQIEECDPTCLDAVFPPEVLRGEGTMVGYSEIFPLAPVLNFSIGSESWFVLDNYCVSPDCNCREVLLQFVKEKQVHDESALKIKKTSPAMYYNYRKKTFEQAQAPEKRQLSLPTLISGLKDQISGFDAEVKKRHLRLKALFKRALSKLDHYKVWPQFIEDMEFEPSSQMSEADWHTPKPGRNDPCPCGSGKKYKKCCGS